MHVGSYFHQNIECKKTSHSYWIKILIAVEGNKQRFYDTYNSISLMLTWFFNRYGFIQIEDACKLIIKVIIFTSLRQYKIRLYSKNKNTYTIAYILIHYSFRYLIDVLFVAKTIEENEWKWNICIYIVIFASASNHE